MRLLMLMALSLYSNVAEATPPGRFTFLGVNECAPFEGVLFDPNATATILSQHTFMRNECDVKIKFALDTQAAEHKLQLENLQIRHDALINEYDVRIQSMQRESDALTTALSKQSKRDPWMWFAIGVVGGVAMSYTIYEVVNE